MANFSVPPGMGVPGMVGESSLPKYASPAIPQLIGSAQNELESRKRELEYRIGLLKQGPLTPEEQVELPTLEQQKQIVDRAIIQKQAAPAAAVASPASGPAGNVPMPKSSVVGAPFSKTPEGYVPPPMPVEARASGTGSVTIDGKTFELGAGGNWDHAGIRRAMAEAEGPRVAMDQMSRGLSGLPDPPSDVGIRSERAVAGTYDQNGVLNVPGVSTFSNPESDALQLQQQIEMQNLVDEAARVPHPAGTEYGMVSPREARAITAIMLQGQMQNRFRQADQMAQELGALDLYLRTRAVELNQIIEAAKARGDQETLKKAELEKQKLSAVSAAGELREKALQGISGYRDQSAF